VKTKIVRIGNSRGVRLPKPLIEEAGLGEDVELKVRAGAIVIAPATGPRAGWAEAARRLQERRADKLDPVAPGRFDRREWKW
jgi:antitoxin MazE